MSPRRSTDRLGEVVGSLVGLSLSYALVWFSWRLAKATVAMLEGEGSPLGGGQRNMPSACAEWLRRRHGGTVPSLTEHEVSLASCVVAPACLTSRLSDVGGLEDVVEEIRDLVVLPLQKPEVFSAWSSKLVRAPRGVLLYGEPGTGKSLLARAVARDSGAALLNVRASTLSDKYFGESNKLVAAMFSLAAKLAPAIIFIDEVDGLLSARRANDADVTLSLRAEFMTHLDGLLTDSDERGVVVLAATNRPYDIDPAVLRRLPRQFRVGLPDERARLQILRLLLKQDICDADLPTLARRTPGYSGSDLEELCRAAATLPLRDLLKQERRLDSPEDGDEPSQQHTRPISEADFVDALRRVKPTGQQALDYRHQQNTVLFNEEFHPPPLRAAGGRPPCPDDDELVD